MQDIIVIQWYIFIKGPYDIKIERIEKCEDEGTREIVYPTRISSHGNGIYEMSGSVYYGRDLDESIHVGINMSLLRNRLFCNI